MYDDWDAKQQLAFDLARGRLGSLNLNKRDVERYGNNPFGKGLLAARNLAMSGRVNSLVLRTMDLDWHSGIHKYMAIHGPQIDQAVAALVTDINDDVLEALVWSRGEFGRTPTINGSAGRDHWGYSAALLAGKNIHGGAVIGETNNLGEPTRDSLIVAGTDFRSMVLRAMGDRNVRTNSTVNLAVQPPPVR